MQTTCRDVEWFATAGPVPPRPGTFFVLGRTADGPAAAAGPSVSSVTVVNGYRDGGTQVALSLSPGAPLSSAQMPSSTVPSLPADT